MDAPSRNAAFALTGAEVARPSSGEDRADAARPPDIDWLRPDFLEGDGLYARLFREGYRFDFFQAVRLAEQLFPHAPPLGEADDVADERLRLRPSRALAFPAADVRRVERLGEGEDALTARSHVRITATFLGLYGVDAPLPSTLIEPAALADEEGLPSALRHFLDVFNHRFYAFFYRSWKKHRPQLHALRPGQYRPSRADVHARRFLALSGLGTPGALARPLVQVLASPRRVENKRRVENEKKGENEAPALPPMRMAAFAGLLARRTRSAEGLRTLLAGFFGDLPVRIIENVPRWIPLQQRPRMGSGPGETARLGINASVGESVYDRSTKFRIALGPMDLETFQALLPGGQAAQQLQALVRLYAPDALTYDVELTLDPEAAQQARLGSGTGRMGAQMGRSAVLGRTAAQAPVRIVEYE